MISDADSNKRIAKNTLFLYFRMFLIMLVSLYTVRVVVKTLGITDYGIYTAVGGVVLMLSFLSQTITSASQRFFSYELGKRDYQKLKQTFNTLFFVYIGISFIILLLAETIGLWFLNNKMVIPHDRMEAAQWVFQFSLLSFVVTILTSPYNAIIIARENMKVYAYVSVVEALLKLLIVYLLLLFSIDKLKLYALLTFLVTFLVCLIYGIICYKKYKETRLSFYWDKDLIKSIFSYSSWTLFGTIANVANNQGNNILLNLFFGPVANAAQSVGRQVGTAVQVFSGNIYTAIRPPLTKSYAEGNYDYMMRLFYLSSKFSFLLLFVIMLPLMLEMEYVLQIWLVDVGEYMVLFTRLTLVYIIVLSISSPITIIVQAANNVKKYHGIVDGFALLSLPLTYLFFKLGFPAASTFWISILVFMAAHGLRVWILKGTISFSIKEYMIKFVFPSAAIVVLSVIPSLWIHSLFSSGLTRFIVVLLTSISFVLFWTFLIGIEKKERSILYSFLKRK